MSVVKLKYEILVSGIYPFEGEYEKLGFKLVSKHFDEDIINYLRDAGAIYFSPYILMCSYVNSTGTPVYLVFEKEETVEIDYSNTNEYDVKTTNDFIEKKWSTDNIESLEQILTLTINNDIKFPVKMVTVYKPDGTFLTIKANFIKTNASPLLSNDRNVTLEKMKRQENRLSSGFAYEKILELRDHNKYFQNALSLFYSSYSVNEEVVSFTLLISALEAIFSKSTYESVEVCTTCSQKMYKIRQSVSENVSKILLDSDGEICKKIKKLYDKRSAFLHEGNRNISIDDYYALQEYVRNVLLMYWYVSLNISSYEHKVIMAEIHSDNMRQKFMYNNFLIGLDNSSFKEKQAKMIFESIKAIMEGKAP